MELHTTPISSRVLRTLALAAAIACAPLSAPAQQAPEQESADAPPTEAQVRARELVLGMARFLAEQPGFSTQMLSGYDVLQDSGQTIQFVETRAIQLQRPRHLRVTENSGDGRSQNALFDGSRITVWDSESAVFAQAEQPATVDDAVLYFERDLKMRLPLAPLLTTWFPGELERRLVTVDYVEATHVFGQLSHHVAARTTTVDFQAWIADGERPLPLRIVITYPEEGHPQFWADFTTWELEPQFAADTFDLVLPEGAQQVAFAIQVPPLEATLSAGEATDENVNGANP